VFLFRVVVQGDGVGYFSYLPAWFRGSMELGPEYAAFVAHKTPIYLPQVTTITATGHHEDLFSVGPAILSLPAYALARLGGLFFAQAHPDATWLPGLVAFTLTSVFLGLAGLLLSFRIARGFTSDFSALLAVLLCWLAGPLLFYMFLEPDYSHTFSTFAVALFILALLGTPVGAPAWRWLVVGLAGGVMAITRWQDGLYLLLGGAALLEGFGPRRLLSGEALARGALFAAGAMPAILLQVLATHVIFGYWLPQPGPDIQVGLLHPALMQLMFSSHHGIFSWSPVLLLGVAGLFLLARRRPWFAVTALVVLGAEVYVSASVTDWWAGAAFGARRLVGAFPLLALGVAVVLERVPLARRRLVVVGGGLLVAWNLLLLAQFRYIHNGDADPGYGGLLRWQVEALPRVPRLFAGTAVHEVVSGVQHLQLVSLAGGLGLGVLLVAGASAVAAVVGAGYDRRQ
jgi:hypothetical protein